MVSSNKEGLRCSSGRLTASVVFAGGGRTGLVAVAAYLRHEHRLTAAAPGGNEPNRHY
jgi:hypothetical protein